MAAVGPLRICVVVLLGMAPQARPGIAARTRTTMEALEARAKQNPQDHAAWNRIADARLALAISSGDLANLERAEQAVVQSLKAVAAESNWSALLLRTRIELALHRFQEARQSAEYLGRLNPESADALGLLGDALFNLGEDAAAEASWLKMAGRDPANLFLIEPRLAQLALFRGRNSEAAARYRRILEAGRDAEDDAGAWANVQLGALAFRSGDWAKAGEYYDAALNARPQYYPALDHQAELRGAEGRFDEAVALYTSLIERTRRPELMQALGDLYLSSGKKEAAASWHNKALSAYFVSVEKGEAPCFHHLAILYSDSLNEPENAVEWARRDLTFRHTISAYDTLAWALYKTGSVGEARDVILRVLSLNPSDPGILYHAGTILMRVGDLSAGRLKLQEAFAVNPRYNTFHVHRE
jgi:tetratricopeptide (TPR) repeat protein